MSACGACLPAGRDKSGGYKRTYRFFCKTGTRGDEAGVFYVYVLESLSYGCRYVGSTGNIEKRLIQHNDGLARYTKGRRPWKLIYFEEYTTRAQAMKRERFLKSGQGREELNRKIPAIGIK